MILIGRGLNLGSRDAERKRVKETAEKREKRKRKREADGKKRLVNITYTVQLSRGECRPPPVAGEGRNEPNEQRSMATGKEPDDYCELRTMAAKKKAAN